MRKPVQLNVEQHKKVKMAATEAGITISEMLKIIIDDANIVSLINIILKNKEIGQ